MPYANKYFLEFKNRQDETFQVYILEKDFVGSEETLEAGGEPFVLEYQSGDEQPWLGIRASSAKISYYNNGGHPLSIFASNNDDQFKVEFYRENTDLLWTGFVVQDDSREPFVKPSRYIVTLQATDNLALLKNETFKEGDFDNLYSKQRLDVIIYQALQKTNLILPFNIFCNVFENGMIDRDTVSTSIPLIQAKIDTRTFLKDESKFEDCYTVLDKILISWKCAMFQKGGRWNIVRWPEAKDFDNLIPGTEYDGALIGNAITTEPVKEIGLDLEIEPINAGHEQSLIRGVKHVELTYNYEMPKRLIINNDFTILGSLISSSISGDVRTDLYEMPNWDYTNPPVTGKYISVKTNIITGVEIDRYGVLPFEAGFNTFLRSNTFEVNKGDRFECSVRFRADSDTSDNIIFRFGIYLLGISGTHWSLTNVGGGLQWNDISAGTTANSLSQTVSPSVDVTEWQSIDLFEGTSLSYIPVIPEDGTLELQIKGFNDTNVSQPNRDTYVKDINFNYIYYINDSTQITGHVHTSTQAVAPKKNYDETIYIDDAPKNAVKGVMFLNDGTTKTSLWHRGSQIKIATADFTVDSGGTITFIGRLDLYPLFTIGRQVTLTGTASNNITFTIADVSAIFSTDHFSVFVQSPAVTANETVTGGTINFGNETFKFGFIQKIDTMFLNDATRTRIEGDYFGLKDTNGHISLLTVFTIATLPGKYFILGPVSFNYMKATWSGTLEELWNESEEFNHYNYTNTFKYLYRQQ